MTAGLMTVQVAAHTRRENALALTRAGTDLVRKGDKLTNKSRVAMSQALNPGQLREVTNALQTLLRAASGDE